MLTLGHESFCETWEKDSLVRIDNGDGTFVLASYIPARDPDLTVYEDVNQVLLNENASQGTKRKLEMLPASQSKPHEVLVQPGTTEGDAENDQYDGIAVLDPEDVSKTFSEIHVEALENAAEPDCSAIESSQVIWFFFEQSNK